MIQRSRMRSFPFVFLVVLLLAVNCGTTDRQDTPADSSRTPDIGSGKSIAVENAVVVTADSIASRVGVDVLRKGGNAVDAAIATAFALAVAYPQAGNIGGGGFMLVRLSSGESHFIDYRETAPARATRDMYLDSSGNVIENKSTEGHLAVGVPGTVAGMALAHERFGSLPWGDLVSYAWRLARDGFPVDAFFVASIAREKKVLESHAETKRVFIDPALKPGDVFRQPDLAETLRRLMTEGPKDFYQGKTADLIAKEMEEGGGLITKADLAAYRAKMREPVRVAYRGYDVISAPPSSSGGIILSVILQILERYDLGAMGFHSTHHVQLLTESEKIAYRLRALYMGDPDFYAFPWEALTDSTYADRLRGLIHPSRFRRVSEIDSLDLSPVHESRETTHFSIVDRWGNAVSNTYTLNGWYGSGVTAAGTGILLNNEMDDFSIKPGYPNLYGLIGSEANAIEPGKRMLSSMSPTIVVKDGNLFMVVGTPGGSTIPTTVLQVISNVIDFHMPLEKAVAEKRIHNQYLPNQISVEPGALVAPVADALHALGQTVVERASIGDIEAILWVSGAGGGKRGSTNERDRQTTGQQRGRLVGVADPRGNGRAIGY